MNALKDIQGVDVYKRQSTNRATADMNFVMYSYPYTDKDTFTKDYFIHKRDSVMKGVLWNYQEESLTASYRKLRF